MATDLFATELVDASYEGEAFLCAELDSEHGHDSVEHRAYLRPGADVEPTGRKAVRGTLEIALYNDLQAGSFPGKRNRLFQLFAERPIGALAHPTEGLLTAHIKTWKEKVDPEKRSGVTVSVEWVEHLASVSVDGPQASALIRGAYASTPSAATQQAAAADALMAAAAPSGGYTPTAPTVAAQLERLETARRTVAEIDASLRAMQAVVATNIDAPALAGIDAHDAVVALAALRSTLARLRSRYLPEESRIRRYVVPVPMAAFEVALAVYQDARQASAILAANSLPDAMFIAPGTVLTILPLD